MLDLACGLKCASRAMRERGWRVVTVDIDPRFEPDVVADLREWSWDGERPALVWASPPCDEFARESMPWSRTGRVPDLSIVRAVERIARECRPDWWILENVRGAQKYLGPARWKRTPVYLWGEFPPIACGPLKPWKERLSSTQAARRAAIPYEISLAVALSIESALPLSAFDAPASSTSAP